MALLISLVLLALAGGLAAMGNLALALLLIGVLAVWHRDLVLDALGAWFARR
jgi:membrane protein DedA with SNARE-associated domain